MCYNDVLRIYDKNLCYIKYECMDEYCEFKGYSHNLNNELHYPWIFNRFNNNVLKRLSFNIIKKIDIHIHNVFKHMIIDYHKQINYDSIINTDKIRFNQGRNLIDTFFVKNIIHKKCPIKTSVGNISIGYNAQDGVRIYCRTCERYLSTKRN